MKRAFWVSVVLLFLGAYQAGAQVQSNDSIPHYFAKGRWLTGLSGSINSTSVKRNLGSSSVNSMFSEYEFSIRTGLFIADQWALGAVLIIGRDQNAAVQNVITEQFAIGPLVRYYLNPTRTGSLYAQFSPVYTRYFQKISSGTNMLITDMEVEGSGAGTTGAIGYAFTANRYIVLELALGYQYFWIGTDNTDLSTFTVEKENIRIGEIEFNFGFTLLIDEFFF